MAVVVLMAVAAGCAGSAPTTETGPANDGTAVRVNTGLVESDDTPVVGGKIVYGLNAETNGWNPATNNWAPSGLQVARSIFDTLTAFDDHSDIHPFLAQSFTHDPTYTDWTFTLRPGVVLTNGKPVTAAMVARNQTAMQRSPVTAQAYAYIDTITATGDLTVDFKTKAPFTLLPQIFATQIGVVADPDWLESNDGIHPIGTGPFRLDSWEIGNKLIAKKNPSYWQRDAHGTAFPYLDEVEFRIIPDNTSRANALESGDVDIIEAADAPTIARFQDPSKQAQYQVFNNSKGEQAEAFIQLNNAVAPFDDVDARRALAFATDQQTLIDNLQGGLFEAATGPFSPSSPWFAASGYPTYDPVRAKALVAKVKAEHGSFSFALTGIAEASSQQLLQALQQQWQQVGIDVTIDTVEQAKEIISVITGSYQAVQWQQFDSANPINDMVWWAPENVTTPPTFSINFARHTSPALSAAMVDWRQTPDVDQQKKDVATLQQVLGADVPYVWLWHNQFAIIATHRLVNVVHYTLPDGAPGLDLHMEAHPLYQVWLRA